MLALGKALEPGRSAIADQLAGAARKLRRQVMGWAAPVAGLGRISRDFSPSLEGAPRCAGWQVKLSRDLEGNDGGRS